jgi:cytochrome c1
VTKQEFDQLVRATCPHCASNNAARFRSDSGEWVHDFASPLNPTQPQLGARVGHTLCLATYLRNSDLARGLTDE